MQQRFSGQKDYIINQLEKRYNVFQPNSIAIGCTPKCAIEDYEVFHVHFMHENQARLILKNILFFKLNYYNNREHERNRTMNIALVPLGCSKNTVDAERMLSRLLVRGHSLSVELFSADVVIVNTCGFIADAKQEGIEHILQLASARDRNPNLKIIVTGCLAQRYGEQILEQLPEVDLVVTPGCNGEIADIVENLGRDEKKFFTAPIEQLPEVGDRVILSPPHYAYVKIADGCDNRCSYCAIPLIRGKQRSRDLDDVVKEVTDLAKSGTREIILVAQDTTAFRREISGVSELPELLEALHDIDGIECIRIMYAYPENIDKRLVDTMARLPKVARYIDMPIQHISDKVLSSMRRRGGSETIKSSISMLRKAMPDIAIRTTVLVGFPGETQEDFEQLLEYIKEGHFEQLGCFAYSKEEDTAAAKMSGQIPSAEKKKRRGAVMEAQYEVVKANLQKRVGKMVGAWAEDVCEHTGRTIMRAGFSAPEVDTVIYVDQSLPMFERYEVLITDIEGYDLIAQVPED